MRLLLLSVLLATFSAPTWAAGKAPYALSYVGDMRTYTTLYEDTLIKIARENDIGFNELRSANPDIDPWVPGADKALILPMRHLLPQADREGIVINLPEMRLYYFAQSGMPPETYPLGVGREGLATPTGKTQIVRKTEGPIWRPTARMRKENPDLPDSVGAGPDNPMGTHALYLGWPQYALHGTNKPYGIGRRVSSGCIRLYPEDIVRVYRDVPVGTQVMVVNQPVKAGWIGDEFYVEVHPAMDQADKIEQEGGLPSYQMSAADMDVIVKAIGDEADALDWPALRRVMHERSGYPVLVARRDDSSDTPGDELPDDEEPEEPAAPLEAKETGVELVENANATGDESGNSPDTDESVTEASDAEEETDDDSEPEEKLAGKQSSARARTLNN